MTDLINRTHGTDGDGDVAPGSPDALSSVQSGPVETGAVETDAVETDAVETGAVETDAVETGAVETGRKRTVAVADTTETTDDAPWKGARTVRTPAAAKLATAAPKPGAAKNTAAKNTAAKSIATENTAAKSDAPSTAGVESKTGAPSSTPTPSKPGTPKPPESKAGAVKSTGSTKTPAEKTPAAKTPAPTSSFTRSASPKASVPKAATTKAAATKAAATKAAVDKAAVDEVAVDKAAVDKAAVDKAAVDKAAVDKAVVATTPAARTAVSPALVTETAKKPAAQKPAAQKPAAQKPADPKPADRKPADRKPAAQKAADRKPAAQKAAAKVPDSTTAKNGVTGTTATTGAATARPKRPTSPKSVPPDSATSAAKPKPGTKPKPATKPAPTDAPPTPDSTTVLAPLQSTASATPSAIEPAPALPDRALTDAPAAADAASAAPSPGSAVERVGTTSATLVVEANGPSSSTATPLVIPTEKAPATSSVIPTEKAPATPSVVPVEKAPKNAPASAPRATPTEQMAPASVAQRDPRSASLQRAVARTAHSLVYLLPVLAIAAVVQVVNLAGSPARIAEEGTNTAQAWSVLKLGELVRDANWFDHPPLGWLQISGYTGLTGAFDRYDLAVLAAREAMVFFAVVSVMLVWVLARRLRLTRPAAAGAALLFALSPLALQLHRTVYLDNVAVPWLLGAFVLATLRRYQLVAFAGSAVAFSVAMLSGETALLALPFLAWVMWRSSDSETRRYTLPIAGAIVVVSGLAYVLHGSSNGGLTQAPGRGGLLGSLIFPFAAPLSNASLADPGATTAGTLSTWWQLDPVLLVSGVVAAIAALFLPPLRPIAAFVVFSALLVLMPGASTPASYAIVLLPFIALLIAGVIEEAVMRVRSRERSYWLRMADRGIGGVILVGAVAALVIAAPAAVSQIRGLLAGDADRPARQAEQWLTDNVSSNARVIVDDSSWVDLVAAGFAPDRVDGYDPTDAGASAPEQASGTARPADYVVAPASSGAIPAGPSQVRRAVANSVSVVRFGSGDRAVEVRRIETVDPTAARATETALTQKRARAGAELLANPALTVSTGARGVIAGGNLDGRLIVLLGQLAASGDVTVTSAPTGLTETTNVRRMVTLTTGSAAGDAELLASLKAMTGTYAPDASAVPSGLRLTVSADEPDVFG